MTEAEDQRSEARLVALHVADPPEAWAAAGFALDGDLVRLGATTVRLTGPGRVGERGIRGWVLAGVDVSGLGDAGLDGLPTTPADPRAASPEASSADDRTSTGDEHSIDDERSADGALEPSGPRIEAPVVHPNGAVGLDHVVVTTPDLDRTIGALEGAGLECRRIRETEMHGTPMRQAFFRMGSVILEVVSGDVGSGLPAADAPADWWGLAVEVDDLDETAAVLGTGLGSVRKAVQPGRRIATLRHGEFGMSVAVAVMDRHGGR